MNPTRSTSLRHDEESRSNPLLHNEDSRLMMKLRNEEEKLRRRREWIRQQELEKQHEELKRQMILNYERKRTETLKSKRENSHRNQNKSRSKSPLYRQRTGKSSLNGTKILDESTSEVAPLFKGPEGTRISPTELRRIKVDIRRNIPVQGPITELERRIDNPEEVIVKRRDVDAQKDIHHEPETYWTISTRKP